MHDLSVVTLYCQNNKCSWNKLIKNYKSKKNAHLRKHKKMYNVGSTSSRLYNIVQMLYRFFFSWDGPWRASVPERGATRVLKLVVYNYLTDDSH